MEAWIPFFQSLVWPVFLGLLLIFFRSWFRELLDTIKKRIEMGSELSVGPSGFMLGTAPKLEDPEDEGAPLPEMVEKFVAESREVAPQSEAALDMSKVFQLAHSATPAGQQQGQQYYKIQVWLEAAPPALMERVSKVVYHLHPTFPNPDRESLAKESNFELSILGWGQFNLSADIYFDDDSQPLKLFRYINF